VLVACGNGTSGSTKSGEKAAKARGNVSGSTADPGGASSALKPYSGSNAIITSSNQQSKTVALKIIGGQSGSSSGFNFNGYSNGNMVIKVPEGWKVTVDFSVQSSLSHSAVIAPWSEREASSFDTAFAGSAMPDYTSGINKGDKPVSFSFAADKAGKYAIVCAVPGHDDLGMWDEFDVENGLVKPEVLIK